VHVGKQKEQVRVVWRVRVQDKLLAYIGLVK
jgi:hypothetical protein